MIKTFQMFAAIILTLIVCTKIAEGASVTTTYANVNYLNIDSGSWLDILDGCVIDKMDPYGKIHDYVTSGYNYGDWNGWGILSSLAAQNYPLNTLGILTGAEYLFWDDQFHSLDVQPSWNLVEYTLNGDLNFDHKVDGSDLALFNTYYIPGDYVEVTHWYYGDLDYDGYVSDADHDLLMINYVPEPGTYCLLITAALALLAYTKRRGKKSR